MLCRRDTSDQASACCLNLSCTFGHAGEVLACIKQRLVVKAVGVRRNVRCKEPTPYNVNSEQVYLLRRFPLKFDAGVNILPCLASHLIYAAPQQLDQSCSTHVKPIAGQDLGYCNDCSCRFDMPMLNAL